MAPIFFLSRIFAEPAQPSSFDFFTQNWSILESFLNWAFLASSTLPFLAAASIVFSVHLQ
jgi:hypothetical protein